MCLIPGHAFMDGENWREVCGRAMIESGRTGLPDASIEPRAAVLFHEFWKSTSLEEKTKHFDEATKNAQAMWSKTPVMHESLHGLMQSAVIQAWTAFEVMADHLWRAAVAERPALSNNLTSSERKRLGFRSRGRIRESYTATFKIDSHAILKQLDDTGIDALALVRCLLVHSAGKIDDWFMKDSVSVANYPEIASLRALSLGARIEFTGGFVRKLLDPVAPCGFNLIQAVDNWILFHP